jgi:y4mF family transcriptional regulator
MLPSSLRLTGFLYPYGYDSTVEGYIYTRSGILTLAGTEAFLLVAMTESIAQFVKQRRKALRLTQRDIAAKAGVGLRFVRELEQGKATLQLDKVNRVLALFGHTLAPVPVDRSRWLEEA